jgi:hypothetical protein
VFSIVAMSGLVAVQVVQDVRVLRAMSFAERVSRQSLTTLELMLMWTVVGALLYAVERRNRVWFTVS